VSIGRYVALNMFRATLCPSSGADDLVVGFLFHTKLDVIGIGWEDEKLADLIQGRECRQAVVNTAMKFGVFFFKIQGIS